MSLKLEKKPIQQGGNLAFEVAANINEVEAISVQLPQGQQFLLGDAAGLVATKPNCFRNNQSVDAVRLCFTDEQAAHGAGLDRIEKYDLVPSLFQSHVEG